MKVGDTFKNINDITLVHSANANKTITHSIDVRTRIFNEDLKLPVDRAVAFQIKKNFQTDGASIPRFLWWFISPLAWWILFPAIVHDWAWRERYITAYIIQLQTGKIVSKHGVIPLTYKQGSLMMLEKMESFLGGAFQRYIVFYTLEFVRLVIKRAK